MWIQQESTFWSKELWQKAGSELGENCHLAGDFELWLRFSRYEKLYCTDAYLGGFRQRSKNQLSQTNYNEYIQECFNAIKNEPKTKQEVKALKKLKFLKILEKIILKTKIFNPHIATRLKKRIISTSNTKINYSREKQEFNL